MYKSNLAYADDLVERFENQAANAATLEPTGTFAQIQRRKRRPTVASFKDIYAADLRPFRIC